MPEKYRPLGGLDGDVGVLVEAKHGGDFAAFVSLGCAGQKVFGESSGTKQLLRYPKGKTGFPTDERWVLLLGVADGLGPAAVAALLAKVRWENWLNETVKEKGRALAEFLREARWGEGDHQAFAAAEASGLAAELDFLLRNSLAAPLWASVSAPAGCGAAYATRALRDRWYALPIIGAAGAPLPHLPAADADLSGLRAADTEWKACLPKSDAAPLLRRFMDFRLGAAAAGAPPVTWAAFRDAGLALREFPRSSADKDRFLIAQASAVILDPLGRVCVFGRMEKSKDGRGRNAAGASVMLSTSPDPGRPIIPQVEAMLAQSFGPHASALGTVEALGLVVNEMNVSADADGTKPTTERPVYALLVFKARLRSVPDGFKPASPTALAGAHEDAWADWWDVGSDDVRLTGLKNYGDRAVLHALKHPGKARFVGNGSAWMVDYAAPGNADWAVFD